MYKYASHINYLFKNVGKRWQLLSGLLESKADTTDILFIQEPPYIKIRQIPSLMNSQGDEMWGFPKHPYWELIDMSTKYKEKIQAIAYVNKKTMKNHFISIDESTFNDPNILFFAIAKANKKGHRDSFCSFINVYAHPSPVGTRTRQSLIRNFHKVSKNVAILQGDFNLHSSIWDELCRSETGSAGVNLYTTITEQNFQLINRDDEPTWYRQGNIPRVLDLIFVNNNLGRQDVQEHFHLIDEIFDYRTLSLQLAQGKRTILGRPYIKADSEEELNFIQEICEATHYWTCLETAQQKTTRLMTSITSAFEKYAKRPKVNAKQTLWWTDDCNKYKDQYSQHPSKENRKHYYKAIRQAKKTYFGQKIDEMCENNKPWEGVRWTRDRPLSTIPRFSNSTGESITTTTELWPILDSQFNSGNKRQTNINWEMINALPTRTSRTWYNISSFEILEALKSTSNNSAPGYSSLSWRNLKLLLKDSTFITAITMLYNDILKEGVWPTEFKIANTVVIPKPKRIDYLKPKNFRPIALLDCVGKLLSKVLAARLQDESMKYDLLHPLQFGGIKQRSTTDAGLVLTEFVKKAQDSGQFTTCLAIDMAQYFPSLNHQVLKMMLTKLGFAPNITNLFSSYFEERVTIYLWGNDTSPKFSASDGVPQGDPLSPILSDLYVALPLRVHFPLTPSISKNILSFIDDYVLVMISLSLSNNIKELRKLYIQFYGIVEGCGLTIEPEKTEIFHFTARDLSKKQKPLIKNVSFPPISLPTKNEHFEWTDEEIRIKPKKIWRYLGFFFDEELNFKTHIQRYVNKAFSALNAMRMLGNSIEGFTPSKRKLAFSACVWSIATYGAVLWFNKNAKGTKQKANALNKVKNTGMRWITGAFSTTPITVLELISYTPPILAQLNIIVFKYALHINKLSHIHPCRRLVRSFQFANFQKCRIHIKPGPYEKYSTFNMCKDPQLITDEKFVYNHNEQIFGKCIIDLYESNIKFLNFDHPKKGTNLFVQWFDNFQVWLNTIRNEKDHLLIFTDGSFKHSVGTAAFGLWANNVFINSDATQVDAHSAYNAELQAIQLAFKHLKLLTFRKVTLLIDNEAAAKSIWHTDCHNIQYVSIDTMVNFRNWIALIKTKEFIFNVSWCPAHTDVKENELVDAMASDVVITKEMNKTTLESEIRQIKKEEYDKWNKATQQYNALGHGYLALKYKGRHIGPSLGARKKMFIEASKDNIKLLARITRLIMNHAPTGEYRQQFFPLENKQCNYDNKFQSRTHILTKCSGYSSKFKNLEWLRQRKDGLEKVAKFLEKNTKVITFGDVPKGIG
ncbi:hypothetical protein AX15_006087 [Amanita polypyramis BW_CC]|nr:hypothetical protein AX15_006087 [Amanita polypyramis BW_CC]